jgi:hypothetical protein
MFTSGTARALLLAVAGTALAPHLAPHLGSASTTGTRHAFEPLAITRTVHALSLRAAGAAITHHADDRLQRAYNDCALAVVEHVHARAQRAVPPRPWLARALKLGPDGVALGPLSTTLTQLGWNARVTRDGTRQLATLRLPAITLMHPGHYVLLTARSTTHVEYFDPLVGQVRQPLPPFTARWTGNSVQLSPADR